MCCRLRRIRTNRPQHGNALFSAVEYLQVSGEGSQTDGQVARKGMHLREWMAEELLAVRDLGVCVAIADP